MTGPSHVEALAASLAAFGKSARSAIVESSDAGELVTSDMFTEIARGVDKWLWFVEARQQADK